MQESAKEEARDRLRAHVHNLVSQRFLFGLLMTFVPEREYGRLADACDEWAAQPENVQLLAQREALRAERWSSK